MRSMQVTAPIGGILRNGTDAIWWGTLHGIVQALHRWRAEHRQRQQQGRWRGHQLKTIGWKLRIERAHLRRAGSWIVLPLLTFAGIGESSNGTQRIPREKTGRFMTLLEGSQATPSDMETWDRGFGCWDTAEIIRLLWETSSISMMHTARFHNCGWWIGGCRLCLSTAMGSRYTTQRRLRVRVEVEVILWAWHTRLEGDSTCMWRGWMWRLQERGIEREDNWFGRAPGTVDCFWGAPRMVDCLGGASGKLYLCFLWSLALQSSYSPGGVSGRIWVRSSLGLVEGCAPRTRITLVLVYVSSRLSESQWVQVYREIQDTGHHTTASTIIGLASWVIWVAIDCRQS